MIAVQGNRILPIVNYKNWQGVGTQVAKQGIDMSNKPDAALYLPGYPGLVDWTEQIKDRSGNANHGTIIGAQWSRLASGLRILNFDGSDDYVNCGSGASLDTPNEFTVTFWMNVTANLPERIPINKVGVFYTTGWLTVTSWGEFNFKIGKGGADWDTWSLATDHTQNIFQFWSLTAKSNDKMQIYRNGAFVNETAIGQIVNTIYPFTLGRLSYASVNYFNGLLGGVRIYPRALSAPEIQLDYNREHCLFGV